MGEKVITARVFRFNPQKEKNPNYEVYKIQTDKHISVLNLIAYIHQNIDRTLAYRNYICNVGVCLSCLLQIDGKNARACTKTVNPGDTITIEPPKGFQVIRDLVVDFRAKKKA